MVEVFHVHGKKLDEMKNPPYKFLNGDVYLIKNYPQVYIWLGSKAYADDRAVGAWAAELMDLKDDTIEMHAEPEGDESPEFKALVDFQVVEGDTPGFLKHIETVKTVDLKLHWIRDVDIADGSSSDDLVTSEVPVSRKSLKSDDTFVLDAGNSLFVWFGKNSQVGEKVAGDRLARKLDVQRKRTPIIYQFYEGQEPKEFLDILAKGEGEVKLEKKKTKITDAPKKKKKKEEKKKGFLGRLFGR